MGVLLAMQGKHDLAIEEWNASIRLGPSNVHPRQNLAGLFRTTGRWDDAVKQLRELVKLTPDDGEAWATLGESMVATGDRRGALSRSGGSPVTAR